MKGQIHENTDISLTFVGKYGWSQMERQNMGDLKGGRINRTMN